MREWHKQGREYFGARWDDVLAIQWTLKTKYGIHNFDARPGNINFGD